jgi:hypothetical protein
MNDFDPKEKSKGFGDTIAKITNATGLDKAADAIAKAMGKDDCGCNKRRKTLNEILPYKQEPNPNIKELKEISGNYEVLQEIHCTLPEIGKTILNKGTILTVNKNHPLYKDIPFYFKKNIIKKL